MISVNNLSVSFGGRNLFDSLSFIIKDKDRIGLTGKNGAGKSTLLKIIAGKQACDKGDIVSTSGHEIAYLPQEMIPEGSRTVLEEAMLAFEKSIAIEKNIERLTQELSSRTDYESAEYHKLIDQLSEENERLNLHGRGNNEAMAEKVLLGLGFKHSDFSRSITEFSSGWQMRVFLAKILLAKPEVMLLDEPTNHLDIESIEWLECFLQTYYGAVVVVSHDRRFLDNITKRTIEITLGRIEDYNVPYSEYVEQRAERRAIQENAYNNQQKEIEAAERFIERFRYKATKARQAQSRIKQLQKMEIIEVDEEDKSAIAFKFLSPPHSGKIMFRAENLGKSYGEKKVFSGANIVLERGEKVAFVGRNGEGKSTFSKIIVGEIADHSGVFEIGHGVKIGYFAQNQAALLDGNKTVFETIDEIAVGEVRTKTRNILGCFLFSGDDIDKKVKVLSGGEKTRLAIAKLLLEPVNLLVLDEPTNHLDLRSKDILKAALLQYTGALVIVSHDRDFLDALTQKVYEFRDGVVKEHIGDISDFLQDRKLERLQDLERSAASQGAGGKSSSDARTSSAMRGNVSASPAAKTAAGSAAGSACVAANASQPASAALSWQEKKQNDKELRKKQNEIKKLEAELAELEEKLGEMDKVFIANPAECTVENCNKYEEVKRQIDAKMERWMLLSEDLA